MSAAHIIHRPLLKLTLFTFCALIITPMSLHAQEETVPRLELRPHCEQQTDCPSFEVRDPLSLRTPILSAGDTMDLDLVLHNPTGVSINRFRIWLAYDPMQLEGKTAVVSEHFPTPTPGETGFERDEGLLKLSGTAQGPPSDTVIVLARLTMQVREPQVTGSPLTFYDNPDTPEPETGIFAGEGAAEQNILTTTPGYLYVRMSATETSTSSEGIQSSAATASEENTPSSATTVSSVPNTVFTLLQVQGLRVTTEGSSAYLAWDALPSGDLIGYHLYYGTVSGQYIQRNAIDGAAISTTIRALPVGTTYYFAIRGVNAQEQETDFSREVGVSVGNPRTSTAPFVANTLPTPTPDTNGAVAGDTGVSSSLAFVLLLSAAIGTFVAFRRQMAVQYSPTRS